MAKRPSKKPVEIDAFDLAPGRVIAGKYVVESQIGVGYEGEVYKVIERSTGIPRAAKIFFPQRNVQDRAIRYYAKKLDRLRACPILIQYHHSETFTFHRAPLTCLISEFVEGELLSRFITRQRGKRFQPFEALHLLHTLASGVERIHAQHDYHGDLHTDNVLISRRGIEFDVKLVDFYHHGPPSRALIREDVLGLIEILFEAIGGRRYYASQPPEIKAIVRGLRRDLIARYFPTAGHLRAHLETFPWSDG